MEIPTQIIPPAVIDRGHQATQQLNSNHTLRLLALIDTYRGPTRIQTSLVVPDQSDKPVPDQIDILICIGRRRRGAAGRKKQDGRESRREAQWSFHHAHRIENARWQRES